MVRIALLLVASALAAGCSSSSTPGSSGTSGTSGASTNLDCSFSGSLGGGVVGTIAADGCGTTTSATFSIVQADFATGQSRGVRFELKAALKGGELGEIPLDHVEVFKKDGKNAATLSWSSASCTLTLDKNVASPTNVFVNRFLLAGKGSCSAPFEPTAPNTLPAVTVTAFELTAFVDPR